MWVQVKAHGIPHRQLGKLIVCQSEDQREKIEALHAQAVQNGVSDCRLLTAQQCSDLEPAVRATAGMHSPSTGIVDSHALMDCLLGELQQVQSPGNGLSCTCVVCMLAAMWGLAGLGPVKPHQSLSRPCSCRLMANWHATWSFNGARSWIVVCGSKRETRWQMRVLAYIPSG